MEIKQPSLVETAALIAYSAHEGQTRKGDESPYYIHPCMVALKLAKHGFDETVIAAGFVHDVLEDTSVTKDELLQRLGKEVLDIVLSVTEDKTLPWEARKAKYIETVRAAGEASKAVSMADKIHNMESLLSAHAQHGQNIWNMFNRGREQKYWFESSMLKMFQAHWQHPLIDEYADLVRRFEKLD